MEPRIRYATTADGVSIAYWSAGQGIPLVCPPPALPWSHVELEWQIPEWRHWYEHLLEHARVIRYDNRGSGLSERGSSDFSLDALVADLETVVDRIGAEKVALFACFQSGTVAMTYAARHPERVSHLLLWCASPSMAETGRGPQVAEALNALISIDYELFTETLAHTVFGWDEGESAHQVALYMQQSLTQETAQAYWKAHEGTDVTPLLPSIQAPTLVMHRRGFQALEVSVARQLASQIPDARLKLLDGKSLSPYVGDMRAVLDAMHDFLGTDTQRPAVAPRPHAHDALPKAAAAPGGFRTIMFTDMEGSTAVTQRLGDDAAQELVRLHNTIVNDALAACGGSQVKHTGDGIMASFPSASSALDCAVSVQRSFARHNAANPRDRVSVRIGINAGEPVAEGNDLFGTAVQLASRICARAEPGEVLTSDVVRQLVAGKGFLFSDRGEAELRGFEDPVRLYEVRWRDDG